jgi:hypothetical protein
VRSADHHEGDRDGSAPLPESFRIEIRPDRRRVFVEPHSTGLHLLIAQAARTDARITVIDGPEVAPMPSGAFG